MQSPHIPCLCSIQSSLGHAAASCMLGMGTLTRSPGGYAADCSPEDISHPHCHRLCHCLPSHCPAVPVHWVPGWDNTITHLYLPMWGSKDIYFGK